MMDDLNGDLEEKKRSLTREYELLQDNSIPALTGVLGGLEKQALAEIEARRIPLPSRQEQEGIYRCAYEKAKEQMDAITTRSELRQYLQKEEGLMGTWWRWPGHWLIRRRNCRRNWMRWRKSGKRK
ncbi:MAG: hypothetical protein ACLRT5_01220 [Lachnospiraceae bacterium]